MHYIWCKQRNKGSCFWEFILLSTEFEIFLQFPFLMKQEGIIQDPPAVASKYSRAYNHYIKTQSKIVIPHLTTISKTCQYGSQFPVFKLLKAVSKFFLLNEIEIIFFSYIIRQTKWDIKDRIISLNAEKIQDLVSSASENLDYKKIILYLMVAAFTVKYYLNRDHSDELQEATKRCPNFKQIFQNWAKKNSHIATKINPRTLNTVYKNLFADSRKENQNYNIVVDSILQISPAYNPEKDKTKKQDKKKSQTNAQFQPKHENIMLKHDKTGYIPVQSSYPHSNLQDHKHSEEENVHPFMPFKSDRISQEHIELIGSSIIGLKDQPKMIGLGDAYSEQFEDGRSSLIQQESIQSFGMLGMNRGISITEKYLSSEAKIKPEEKQKDSE